MSAFNNARYNLSPFNYKTEQIKWLEIDFAENVRFISATSETRFLQFEGNEFIQSNNLQGARGYIKPAETAVETISKQLTAYSYFKFSFNENISIDNSLNASQYAFPYADGEETIKCSVLESSYNLFSLEYEESINPGEGDNFHLSQLLYSDSEGTEVVDGNTSVEAYDEYVCDLSEIILQPGEVIVIDAGNYDVLLNKQNAIHYQSGEWIDEMNRSTKSIKIVADYPDNLSATILFTERYL